jgi:hypothetical protein
MAKTRPSDPDARQFFISGLLSRPLADGELEKAKAWAESMKFPQR